MTYSTRKSFLSALYGNYVKKGIIDLDKTIGEIGLDDEPPLSDIEKTAPVRDCLKARSGIYHTALYESSRLDIPLNSSFWKMSDPNIHQIWFYFGFFFL